MCPSILYIPIVSRYWWWQRRRQWWCCSNVHFHVFKRTHKMYLRNQKYNKALVQYFLCMSRGAAVALTFLHVLSRTLHRMSICSIDTQCVILQTPTTRAHTKYNLSNLFIHSVVIIFIIIIVIVIVSKDNDSNLFPISIQQQQRRGQHCVTQSAYSVHTFACDRPM